MNSRRMLILRRYISVHNGIMVFEFPEDYLDKDEESRIIQVTLTVFDQDNLFSTDTITLTVNSTRASATANPILWIGLLSSAAVASSYVYLGLVDEQVPLL